jgi:hypothetical protein
MVSTQPSDIQRNHCTHPGKHSHSHGICPTTQLSWFSLKWTDVYTSSGGGKIDVMYIINVCKYLLYHLSYQTPPNDNVCGTRMEFIVMYIGYIHNQVIYIEITVLTPGNIRHSHGTCPTTQLSLLSLEWINVYTSSGEGQNSLHRIWTLNNSKNRSLFRLSTFMFIISASLLCI